MPESDLLYAELLSNIRQISVVASLKSPTTHETTLKLSEDGHSVSLTHNGSTQKLTLPAPVAANSQHLNPRAAGIGTNEISWRLPLLDQSPQKKDEDFSQAAIAPWAATDLPLSSRLLCRKCKVGFSAPDTIKIWKDLPSENWAEMMDFWHCHKPSDHGDKPGHDGHEDASHQKGYGANTKFMAETGTGFVGLTYFLLSETDCQNIEKTSPDSPNQPQTILCKNCSSTIGTTDNQAEGLHLYKWALSIPPSPDYPLSNFLTSQIASLISSQAINKFILRTPSKPKPTAKPTPSLHTWIFTPKMTYSLSHNTTTKGPQLAMKLFFKTINEASILDKLLDDAAVEEISLPENVLLELLDTLDASTKLLPFSIRKFQSWDVAVLDRFDDIWKGRGL